MWHKVQTIEGKQHNDALQSVFNVAFKDSLSGFPHKKLHVDFIPLVVPLNVVAIHCLVLPFVYCNIENVVYAGKCIPCRVVNVNSGSPWPRESIIPAVTNSATVLLSSFVWALIWTSHISVVNSLYMCKSYEVPMFPTI